MIHEYLSHGAHNAISAAELCRLIGVQDHRKLRYYVERERRAGEMILSDEGGYYLPDKDTDVGRAEVARYIAARMCTAQSIIKTVNIAQDYLKAGDSVG